MKPIIAEDIPIEVWDIFNDIKKIVENLPDMIETTAFIFGVEMKKEEVITHMIPNCHIVARALKPFFPVEVHDGVVSVFDRNVRYRDKNHSWLTLPDYDDKIIIDPWPLGVVSGPAMFIQDYAFHFRKGKSASDFVDKFKAKIFESQVSSTIEAVQKVIEEVLPENLKNVS